ncbi:hypothetical protein LEMLEM_LOCUS533, partial [Lemmus lemmus]
APSPLSRGDTVSPRSGYRDPTGLTAAGTPPPASSRARRPLAVAAAHSRSPRSSRAAPALRTYLRDKVTRLVRPGGRPRVSGVGERAGRGAVWSPPLLLGSWLSASALPCALLPPPLPSLDRSQRLGLPRAQGSRAPGAGQRRRPSQAGSSWPLGAERARAEQGVTRSPSLAT